MSQDIITDRDDGLYDLPEDLSTQTPLQNRYVFWYHRRGKSTNYEESMKQIASFQTVEHFWRIYDHLVRPNEFKNTTDYHLFKDGIKPTWEDPANKQGGKWMVRLKKGISSRYWEDIVFAIIGEQFDVGHEICGAVCSVRNNEDIISVWNKNAENAEATNKIRDQMRRILRLPTYISIEYKKHQDSLTDKSSFRNPSIVWRAPGRGDRGEGRGYRDRGDREGGGPGGDNRERVPRGPYSSSPRAGEGEGGGGGGGHSYHGYRDRDGQTPKGTAWKYSPRESSGDPVRDAEREKEREKDRERERPNAWGARSGGAPPPGAGWAKAGNRDGDSGGSWFKAKGAGGATAGSAATPTAAAAAAASASPRDSSERKKASQADAVNVWSRGRPLVAQAPAAAPGEGH